MHDAEQPTRGQWYVAHCRPRIESLVARGLEECLGLTAYLAEVSRRIRNETKSVPLFPGYFFMQADQGAVNISSINSTPGIRGIPEIGGEARAIPETLIATIRERVDRLNAGGGLPARTFQDGAAVLLRRGPLKGLEAEFLGATTRGGRVKVLLHFLGRLNEVGVDADELEPAAPQARPTMQRHTRGRGRPIKK
ncbi:MAG TPA: transcription termination/antitermination NusG family protein [Chloroflexia bacterium]|nr:transcription termination/antitermination NusG family protein [Chloroflexia bacterium]